MKLSDILAQREKKNKAAPTAGRSATAAPPAESRKTLKVLRTRETPNPNALQFVLNAQVIDFGKKSFSARPDCAGDSLGEALFDLRGVQNVFITENFITVTKDEFSGWNPLKNQVWEKIDRYVTFYRTGEQSESPKVDTGNYQSLSNEEKLKAIETVLDRSIRSNLAKDGGGVDVKGLEGNQVLIHYQGACGNCPSSTAGTLQYIEKQFKQQLANDLTVKSV